MQCLGPMDRSLSNYSLVLQGTGIETVTNAVMASAPGNTFWLDVLHMCQKRASLSEYDHPISSTGPGVVAYSLQLRLPEVGLCQAGFTGLNIKVRAMQLTVPQPSLMQLLQSEQCAGSPQQCHHQSISSGRMVHAMLASRSSVLQNALISCLRSRCGLTLIKCGSRIL